MRVTVKDVAAEAQCSTSLVSFYLNHPETTRVAAETRKRIDKAVEKLHYRPNLLASILKGGRKHVVGVLIDSEAPDAVRRLLAKLEREASRRNLYLQAALFHDDLKSLQTGYTTLKQYGACGVICLSHDYPSFNRELERFFADAADVVFYNSPEQAGHPCLIPDAALGIRMAIDHLCAIGHRRIALCIRKGERIFGSIQARMEGYQSLGKNTLPLCLLPNELQLRESIKQALLPFVAEHRPDALLMLNDRFALSAMQLLVSQGIRIPQDIAVIGFDNDPAGAEATPALSTIGGDGEKMAEILLDLLFERLSPEKKTRTVYIPPRLVIRESC